MKYGRKSVLKLSKTFISGSGIYVAVLAVCSLATIPVSLLSPKIFQLFIDEIIRKDGPTCLFMCSWGCFVFIFCGI